MTQASEKRIQVVEILSNLEDVPALEELLTATGYEPSSYSDLEEQRGTTYLQYLIIYCFYSPLHIFST